jgi:hypothetical protein
MRSYELDIRVIDGNELWSTWLLVPTLTTRVEKISATLQLCYMDLAEETDPSILEGTFMTKLRIRGDNPTALEKSLFGLIERFLQHGPMGKRSKPEDKQISLKVQEVNVATPRNKRSRLLADEFQQSIPDTYSHSLLCLFDRVKEPIEMMLTSHAKHTMYSVPLYERVGFIRILENGVLKKEYNLAKTLSTVDPVLKNSHTRLPTNAKKRP